MRGAQQQPGPGVRTSHTGCRRGPGRRIRAPAQRAGTQHPQQPAASAADEGDQQAGSQPPALEPDALAHSSARELSAAYDPFRRYYQTQQRDMQLAIAPLRGKVREALARSSPALRQLAALDATFDAILQERETRLLASVPQLLMRRFAHWHKNPPASHAPSDFGTELQTVLLAELELRLQTTQGLIEAMQQEPASTP